MAVDRLAGLEAELEGALLDAMQGDPWGSALAGRLKLVARSILLRRGLGAARVEVGQGPDGAVQVQVLLPPQAARVRRLVIGLDRL